VAGRRRSPRRPAERPDQILDAAERLLTDGTDLNMDLVAQVAGLSKGTLYHYYATRSDLLDALRRRYLDRTVRQALATIGGETATMTRLQRFIYGLLDDANANGALVWALFHDTGTTGNMYLSIVSDPLRELINEGVAAGDLAIDDAESVASFFAHGCFGRIQDAFHGPGIQPGELAGELTTMLERLVNPTGSR
jgi:AcrR family transcriptional regulator